MIPYIVLIVFVLIVLIINKFKSISTDYNIVLDKIHLGENEIQNLLETKTNLMDEICEYINDMNENPVFSSIQKLSKKKYDTLNYDKDLSDIYNDLKEYLFVNKSFVPENEINDKIKELYKIEDDLIATKRFYNDNSEIFNDLIDHFPANIIARKKGYEYKYTYSFGEDEFFAILKENETKHTKKARA